MKARARKSGGAYRNYKQKMTCHAKPGKDRRAARGQVKQQSVEYMGYRAVQHNNIIAIFKNSSGNCVAHFQQDEKQTAEQLKGYIEFYAKLTARAQLGYNVQYCFVDETEATK